MSNDKQSNEEYYKARATRIVKYCGLQDDMFAKSAVNMLYDLHNEVKDRIDQTEELPFDEPCKYCINNWHER
jgi:hypothetical protein